MLITVLLAVATLSGPDPDGVVVTAPATPVVLDAVAAPEAGSPQAAARAQSRDARALTTDEQIDQWLAGRDPDRSAWADEDMGPLDDRKMHGQVSAGVGTGGYRQYGAAVSLPIGDSGRLDLSYQQVENAPWRYRYGDHEDRAGRFDDHGWSGATFRTGHTMRLGLGYEAGDRSRLRESGPYGARPAEQ
jgi:hypothetical protein